MRIDDALIRHLEGLSRLELEQGERERLARDLERILEHVSLIGELDLEGVEPTASVAGETAPPRADEPAAGLSQEEALAAAPESEDGHFRVPPILDEEEHA